MDERGVSADELAEAFLTGRPLSAEELRHLPAELEYWDTLADQFAQWLMGYFPHL